MSNKIVSAIMLSLLVISAFTSALKIQSVKADGGTIYIRADGSVDPPIANIATSDYVTYTFVGNINDQIRIERSNITIDGNGYTLQGSGSGTGFYWSGTDNVTIQNTTIKDFYYCIWLESSSSNIVSRNNITNTSVCGIRLYPSSSNNIVSGNNITNNGVGIVLESSSGNSLSGNNITNNNMGIHLYKFSNNNIVSGNNITNNYWGIWLDGSSSNSVSENNITDNHYGILDVPSFDNCIDHNNFVDNTQQVCDWDYNPNIWDDGYPYGGNYWSDYTGLDLCSGPYQNESGSDGIGDTSYVIDSNNKDNYPLMSPFQPSLIRVLHVSTNMNSEVQRIVENVSLTATFMVTQVSLRDFNTGVTGNLSEYDVVVFGINNEGEQTGPYNGAYERTAELKSYVEAGGGIVWTHDTLEFGPNHYNDEVEGPAGVDYCDAAWVGGDVFNLRILQDHPVLHAPFEIGNVGDLIPKTQGPPGCAVDHTSGGTATAAEIIIEHQTESAPNNFFLTVNEYSRGRVAVIELGDAMGFDGTHLESTRENQILVNAIYWAGSVRFQSEWGDADIDGIPNYLDHAEFNATLLDGNPSLFDMNWGLSLWYITPRSNIQDMMSVLQQWGIDVAGSYDYAYALVVDLTSPFAKPSDFLDWLEQYFALDITLPEFAAKLHEISGSDSHIRLLIVAKNLSVGSPEVRCYWLVDHSPIAAAAVVVGVILVLPTVIQICCKAIKAISGKYEISRALSETVSVVLDLILEIITGAAIATGNPFAVQMFAFTLSKSYVDAVKELADVWNGDPYYDLCLYDSAGQPVLGYKDGTVISASPYGLYFGRNDGTQLMLLSTLSLPCNLTVTLEAETEKSFVGCIQDFDSNSSIILSGIIAPNETISGLIYSVNNQTMVNHLRLDYNLSEQCPFKGDVVSIDAHVEDENMTDVSDAAVQLSYANQTVPASNLGNGNYRALLDTSLLEYGNTTINIIAGRQGCLGTSATESVSISYDIAIKEISLSKSTVGLVYEISINITLSNFGNYAGMTNVTLYANTTIIETKSVDLEDGNSTLATFSWNTTGFAYGNYTISAYAWPSTGETDAADNNFTGGVVKVTIPGDINGDFKCALSDLSRLAKAFNTYPGDANWNPNADINGNGNVGLSDLSIMAKHFNQHYP